MTESIITEDKYPVSVLDFEKEWKDWYHPTQKPVELLKWLIKTYSNENEVVLDNTAGSMSTAIAALETNRKCICIEKGLFFIKKYQYKCCSNKNKLSGTNYR
jgi:site-specific DNA-methyltransferase (adenine-specific)